MFCTYMLNMSKFKEIEIKKVLLFRPSFVAVEAICIYLETAFYQFVGHDNH